MSAILEKSAVPAYIPYRSFINFLNTLRDTGLPARIDRSVMRGMSGSGQSAMQNSLEFLRLIDQDSKPSPLMKKLVAADDDSRKAHMKEMLEGAYGFIFEESEFLEHATGSQVAEKFRERGVSGSTVTKCVGFFLAAAKDADVKVSPHVRPPQPPRNQVRRPLKKKGREDDVEVDGIEEEEGDMDLEDMERFQIPIPGKKSATVIIPKDLSAQDWEMLTLMLNAYIKRLQDQEG